MNTTQTSIEVLDLVDGSIKSFLDAVDISSALLNITLKDKINANSLRSHCYEKLSNHINQEVDNEVQQQLFKQEVKRCLAKCFRS
jgi:hypothetical protein